MWKTLFFGAGMVLISVTVGAQTTGAQSLNVQVANVSADLTLLKQQIGELSLRIEQLERDNAALRTQTASSAQAYATVQQLNDAITDLNRAIKSSDAVGFRFADQFVEVAMEFAEAQIGRAHV